VLAKRRVCTVSANRLRRASVPFDDLDPGARKETK